MNFIKKHRESAFPGIKDFSKPLDHLRYKHPKNQTLAEFMWFSPDAYKIINIGTPLVFGFIFAGLTHFFDGAIIDFILIVAIAIMGYKAITITNRILKTDINMYDIFIRDYTEGKKP